MAHADGLGHVVGDGRWCRRSHNSPSVKTFAVVAVRMILRAFPLPSSMPQSTRMPDRGGALYHFNTFTLPRTGRPPKMAHSSHSRMVDFPATFGVDDAGHPVPALDLSVRWTRTLVSFTLTSLISLAQVSQGRAWRGASVHVVGQGRPAWSIKDS